MKAGINPDVTPVWFICGDGDSAVILHATFKDPRAKMWGDGGKWTSRSCWFVTEEEFREKLGVIDECKSCHSPFQTKMWCKPYPELLAENQLCFGCYHWIHDAIPKKDLPGTVIVNKTVYRFDVDKPIATGKSEYLGHAGGKFTIHFNDGRVVTTNNLWNAGRIPSHFIPQLPDNAKFA